MGIAPAAGRLLEANDDLIAPAAPAALISYGYGQRRFGLNPAAIKEFLLHAPGEGALSLQQTGVR